VEPYLLPTWIYDKQRDTFTLLWRPKLNYMRLGVIILRCVVECDLETSKLRRPWPAFGSSTTGGEGVIITVHLGITKRVIVLKKVSVTAEINWL
jgi:hypothetical protein